MRADLLPSQHQLNVQLVVGHPTDAVEDPVPNVYQGPLEIGHPQALRLRRESLHIAARCPHAFDSHGALVLGIRTADSGMGELPQMLLELVETLISAIAQGGASIG